MCKRSRRSEAPERRKKEMLEKEKREKKDSAHELKFHGMADSLLG
jgi:hypothetical protein